MSFSPYGPTNGPDLLRCTLIGEIKDKIELDRDLSSKYWSSWNSPNQSHGGKTKEYILKNDLPKDIPKAGKTKGWIAVIFGQLNYQRKSVDLPDGWLIIEDYLNYSEELLEALEYLKQNNNILDFVTSEFEGIGIIHIFFTI